MLNSEAPRRQLEFLRKATHDQLMALCCWIVYTLWGIVMGELLVSWLKFALGVPQFLQREWACCAVEPCNTLVSFLAHLHTKNTLIPCRASVELPVLAPLIDMEIPTRQMDPDTTRESFMDRYMQLHTWRAHAGCHVLPSRLTPSSSSNNLPPSSLTSFITHI